MFYWQLVFLLCFSVWKRAEVSGEVVSSFIHNGVDYNNAHPGQGAGKVYSNHPNLPNSLWYRPMEENEGAVSTQGVVANKSPNALPQKVKRTHKRRPEADAAGFYGDTFSNGFGEFETMKKSTGVANPAYIVYEDGTIKRRYPYNNWISAIKRNREMTKSGFHGDVFNGGFGEFHPMRK